ncbi:hypothetical protein FB45DRAFT_200334 [Roridomyces roridus]|uniref:Uncharacterized protein n=1 Tax=Roridomyces roridus TaxID=1738132 RepID=A0AAD7CG18_9AGAR|nr:hypothetical protein FB45DRAFT_200334 [Roridomyces roridus]
MEQTRPARRSSGIYGASHESLASNVGLAGTAAPPAGSRFAEGDVARTTAAGVPMGVTGYGATAGAAGGQAPAPAPAQQPFYKKRWFRIAAIIQAIIGIVLIFVMLFPVVKAIAQDIINKSTLDIQVANISSPTNGSFDIALSGNVAHTGSVHAKIQFDKPVNVSWVRDGEPDIPLGWLSLDTLHTTNKRATINQTATPFTIANETAFGLFTAHMITDQNFTWRLESSHLRVQAVKFPVDTGLKFNKLITLNGFQSFTGNVAIQDFQLPSDNPAGGIDFVAVTNLTNPSPFSLNLGTVVFALNYQNVFLGTGTSTDTVIQPGSNNITLKGVLEPQTKQANLDVVSQLFTNYLNSIPSPVIATGMSTLQSDGSAISWLSTGLQALDLNVPLVPPEPINPINSISIGNFDLAFNADAPWAPSASSDTVKASIALPFGFGVSIGEIANDFNITMMDGSTVAGLSTPIGASTSSITVYGQQNTTGTVDITIANTSLSSPDPDHSTFSIFNTGLTNLATAQFLLVGESRTIANTSLGQISLNPIKVNVSTSLLGLQGLKGLATIETVDVQGGTTEGITLGIQVSIHNPSNLKLALGDLTLALQRDGAQLGTVLMPNLVLNMGNNTVQTTSIFDANGSPQGLQTLSDFVGKKDVDLTITGFDNSTDIVSLAAAMQTLDIDVTLPALQTSLLDSASLVILPTTGRSSNISHVTVSLANPFTTSLEITKIDSTVSAFGIPLGTINSSTSFTNAGKSTSTSPNLELDMNFDPASLFSVTRRLAIEAGLDVSPLDAIVQLGGITYLPEAATSDSPITQVTATREMFEGFDLPTFVGNAFKKLQSDVDLTAGVKIGAYETSLTYTQTGVPTKTDSTLNLILPVLAQPIVQKIVGGSVLGLDTILISDPQQESFTSKLQGSITNAGPFDASIVLGKSGLTVDWNSAPIGSITMDPIKVVGEQGATLDSTSTFTVADVPHLTDFTKTLLTEESFDWAISGDNVSVDALGISVPGVSAAYKVSLKGFNGLKGGVIIKTFDLPSNDPAGGIHLTLEATAANPSQVGISLSSLGFNTLFNGVSIAPVSAGSVVLAPGGTSTLSLVGRLIPQSSSEGLAAVSSVFNNFVHGIDSNVTVQGASAGPSSVTWLNDAIKALQVGTVLPNQGPLKVIKSIGLNELKLLFTEDTAYSPATSSSDSDAAFTLPFAFPLDITALEQTITVGFDGASIAQLAIPKGSVKTDVDSRVIQLTFDSVPFAVFDDQHSNFNSFVAATTTGGTQTLQLSGSANADAQTAVGLLSLSDISFDVESDIEGLQGLDTKPVTVADLDVNHGFPDFLLIKVNSALFNPSNLTVGTGDVAFDLHFQSETIGTADISNMVIIPGNASYPIDVHYSPQGSSAVSAGQLLLENFLQGIDSDTEIAGSTGSTPIVSLQTALSEILLKPVTIPALHQTLIKSATIEFPTNIVQTGVAQAAFTLANPFTASINLLTVDAAATFHNLSLGTIKADLSSDPIHADGHSSVASEFLSMDFNLDPLVIVEFLTILAQENSVDLGPLVQLFQFIVDNPNINTTVTSTVDTSPPTCVSGNQFDVASAILAALKNLKADLSINTSTKLDDFATSLSFKQNSVPVQTDQTALFLIGAVAGPVAQHLVDGSVLAFTEANITNLSDGGFDLSLKGSLTNIGPLDALIEFPEPVNVVWQDQHIAQIALPPVCAAANTGVPDYVTSGHLTITDLDAFTDFATFLLHNPDFTWTISTPSLRVTALGTIFDNVILSKDVSFKAFNGLPGVTISNFQLPSDDPAGGIHIETDAMIPSPAQLGIDLGTVTFTASFMGTEVGPLSGSNLFLAPSSITPSHLSGRIIPQSGSDLDTIGVLFSQFLAGANQTLSVQGDSVQPTGSDAPVSWLSAAFKTLSLQVILPGQTFDIIQSISLNEFALVMQTQDQAFAPLASSDNILATYKNPFGFSLQVVAAGQDILLSELGLPIASLHLPIAPADGGVSTGNVADLPITFQNVPLVAASEEGLELLFASALLTASSSFDMSGAANVSARTSIGDVPINGIAFSVTSSLVSFNSFDGSAALSNVSVTGSGGDGGNQFVVAPLTTTLQNPSNISLDTVDISLPVMFQGVNVGSAVIDTFNVVPGSNAVAAEFHYQPADANDTVAQSFLTSFIQGNSDLPLTIQGAIDSSPFASLDPALSSLSLSASLPGLNQTNLITQINVFITLDSLTTNLVSINFDMENPLDADLTVLFVQSDAGLFNETFAFFSSAIDGFTVPARSTANSGTIDNVLLTQGAVASLAIIPDGELDLVAAATVQVGAGGYIIPWLHISGTGIPTAYALDLTAAAMKEAAQSISMSASASASASALASASASASGSPASASASGSPASASASGSPASPPPASASASAVVASPSSAAATPSAEPTPAAVSSPAKATAPAPSSTAASEPSSQAKESPVPAASEAPAPDAPAPKAAAPSEQPVASPSAAPPSAPL